MTEGAAVRGALGFIGAGAAVRLLSSIWLAVSGFVVSVVLVRALGTDGYGIVGFVASTAGLAGLLAGGGFGVAAARELAAVRPAGAPGPAATIRGLTTVVLAGTAAGALIGAVVVAPRAEGVLPAAIAATAGLLAGRNLAGAATAVARGSGRPLLTDVAVLASSTVILAGSVAVAAAELGRGAALLVVAGGGTVGAAVAVVVIRRLAPAASRPFRPDGSSAAAFLRLSVPYLLAGAAQQVIANVDVVLLGIVRSTDDVGRYEPALRVVDRLALFVPLMLVVGFMPVATRLHTAGMRDAFADLYRVVARVTFWLGLPALLLLAGFPDLVLHALFGDAFPVDPAVVRILVTGYLVNLVGGPNAAALVATGRRRAVLGTTLVGMGAAIATAVVAIPLRGAVGAALATAAGFVVLNAAVGISLARSTGAHPFARRSSIVLASAAIPAAALALVGDAVDDVVVAVVATTAIWLAWTAVLLASGLLPRSDLRALLGFRTSFEATEIPA